MSINSQTRIKLSCRTAPWILLGILFSLVPVTGSIAEGASLAIGAASRPELPHADDHILVKLSRGSRPDDVLGQGGEAVIDRWHTHPVPPGKSPIETVEALASRPGVDTVELDYRVRIEPISDQEPVASAKAVSVNDPYYSYQWHFPAVQASEAWTTSTGGGVVVAVVDSGVSKGGVDLDCHTFVAPYNAITDTAGAAAASDDNGHGTHVAGTIAQCTDNGVGVAGVAFDASLMPVKVLGADGEGDFSWIARGIDWAKDNGADVINMSLGCDGCSSSMVSDAIAAARSAGIVIVAASGNSKESAVSFPASHPDVIAVGATDFTNARALYSNRGSALDLVAPGGDLKQDANGDGYKDGVLQETNGPSGWGYYFYQGTSMATPHVAGAAALLVSETGCGEPSAVQRILEETALDLGPAGFDTSFGHGLIQIDTALSALISDSAAPSWSGSARLTVSDITGTTIKLAWNAAIDDSCVTGYRIYQEDTLIKKVDASTTATTISGLDPMTGYVFKVRAVDTAGKLSQPLMVKTTTLDNIPPKWGTDADVLVLTYGETSLKLGWDAANDNVGVVDYLVRVNAQTVATLIGQQFTVTGLQPGEGYRVEVLARDTAGNWSDPLTAVVNTALEFEDTSGHTFYGDILWMSGSGVTRGCNPPVNDLFCPDDPVTRGQMAAFLVRALSLTTNTHTGFDDVPADSTFAQDIGKLATAGVTRGCNPPANDRFCPDDPVTRAQMAAFLVRALGLTSNNHPGFGDVPSDSTFAEDIGKLATAGVTRGCNPPANNLFCPEDPVTRGQLAAFLRRALD